MQMTTAAGIRTIAAGAALLWLATAAAQQPPVSARRMLVSDLPLSGIDRGLRDNDPARPPVTAASERMDRSGPRSARYAPDSIIVKFKPGTSVSARLSMLALVNGAAAPRDTYTNFDIASIAPGTDPEAAAARLSAQADVEYAQARYRVRPMFVPNDPLYAQQWNYPAIGMERAWDINPGATPDVTIAVLDTGVAFRSGLLRYNTLPFRLTRTGPIFPSLGTVDVPFAAAPDLGGPDRFVAPWDFIWNDALPFDLDGHGTHVSGTIGQLTNNSVGAAGMAFNVRLMPVKVVDTEWDVIFDSPFFATDDVIARGVRYAVDNGAKVLNMSIGRSGPPAPVVRDAIAYAVSRGAFVAVAAGNEFLDGNPTGQLVAFAPEIQGMVSVAAVARDRARAIYSSTGFHIEVAAPGGDTTRGGTTAGILQQTLDPEMVFTFLSGPARYRAPRFDAFTYFFFQGTSMATAHVSGFAALLMQQGITSPAAIEAAMKRYATDLGPSGRDNEFGYGLINPRDTLRGMGLAR